MIGLRGFKLSFPSLLEIIGLSVFRKETGWL